MSLSARRAWIEILVGDCNEAPVVSLSARRAWIEIGSISQVVQGFFVALRKESVDRNIILPKQLDRPAPSLSARRAWIEMLESKQIDPSVMRRSPQGERG